MSQLILPHRPLRTTARSVAITTSSSSRNAKQEESISRALSELTLEPHEEFHKQAGQFSYFVKLLAEIRMMIWRCFAAGFPASRIVEVFYSKSKRSPEGLRIPPIYHTNTALPFMASICQETRAAELKLLCPLDGDAKIPIMINPLSDAIYLRYRIAAFPGLKTVRHLIVDDYQSCRNLAKYTHLEKLTLIVHAYEPICNAQKAKLAKQRSPLKFRRPDSVELDHCNRVLSQQQSEMDEYERKHPLWKRPAWESMLASIKGQPCCKLEPMGWPRGGWRLRQATLQKGDFWDQHSTPGLYC